MNPQDELELKGDLRTNPLAELLVEVSNARLSGTLRTTKGDRKSVFYFKHGTLLYAVSNAREHRLFSLLLLQKKVAVDVLKTFDNPASDHDLTSWLKNENILPAADVNFTIIRQIETVITDALSWTDGEWVFDPLTRAREGMKVAVDILKLVTQHARTIPDGAIARRFRPHGETFAPVPQLESRITLDPLEKFVLERFSGQAMSLDQIREGCTIPEDDLFRSLYSLWLAGLLRRELATSAFSIDKVDSLKSAKYSLVSKDERAKETKSADISIFADRRTGSERTRTRPVQDAPVSNLPEYLSRVEKATDLYQVLGVTKAASADQIKRAYLMNARSFHPDKFHRETPENLRRIHHAFSEIARAHETLKSDGSRGVYDVKLKKEADAKRRSMEVTVGENETQAGVENFEQGLHSIAEDNYAEAATHFSRAVHTCPQSARFHAYFGKALSAAEDYQHKAEGEFQTALKIAPGNVEIRMMYIDFLIDLKMIKRAEGELARFLEIVPGNKEAVERLAKLGR